MTIKQIVVHPKGATHVEVLCGETYWLKQLDSVWHYFGPLSRQWRVDPICINNDEAKPIHQFH